MDQFLLRRRFEEMRIASSYSPSAAATAYHGDCMDLLVTLPDKSVSLFVTSPPYNIGKEYEKRQAVRGYIDWQDNVISECLRALADDGSICWQVGNYVENGSVLPIDILLHPIFEGLGM